MTRINTNIEAQRAVNFLQRNQEDLALRLERLATGLRINRGADDPSGLIVSQRLRSEMRTIEQAVTNSARASNVISTAEGAMNEVSALLVELQALIVATANEGGISDEEVRANQLAIDSILTSIDRIGSTTTFGGEKLLDGTRGYILSAVTPTELASVSVMGAQVPYGSTRNVTVEVTQSAQAAEISFVGAAAGSLSTTSATTIEVKGTQGSNLFSFIAGTTLAEIRNAINNVSTALGISAVVSTPAAGTITSALLLNSTTLGSDAFVSVTPLSGNFVVNGNYGAESRATGVDAGVLIDGQVASVKGLRADVRGQSLDTRIYLAQPFGQALGSSTFTITGGGVIFQLTPEVNMNGQIATGFSRVSTTALGNTVLGLLYSLRSGGANDLDSRNFDTAQTIVDEAIDQVSGYRARLGSLQRDFIDPNVNSQMVTLENVTASESVIRDADMAEEVSALSRAEILVQSTQATLQIATAAPRQVLSLLQ